MSNKNYVSLEKLSLYNDKIKGVISGGDEKALDDAKAYADSLAGNYEPSGSVATAKSELQGDIDALEALVGVIPETATSTNVVAYVDERTSGIVTDAALESLTSRVSTAEGDIDAIESDYLKAADKAELQGSINTNTDAIAAIKEDVDAFFLDADMTESAKDTLKELQTYIASDETAASQMAASIKENTDAIDVIESRLDTAEGKVSANEQAINSKVDKVEGKELSTNDLTDELKVNYDAAYAHSQVAHAPADAQTNIVESVKVNGTVLEVTDKSVDITVPTDNADLANGAGYLVAGDIVNKADKATTLAGYGIDNAYTKDETDTAIENAINAFEECSEDDINNLFV
jgi:hypothetical protein